MSKLLWKSLLISPAVLGVTLVSSTVGVRAADSANLPIADTQTAIPEVQLGGVADITVSEEIAVNPEQLSPASLEVKPEAQPTLAQIVPATPNDAEILNQINDYSSEGGNSSGQVTSVGQLRDVSPGDWAYEALRSLVERYGCIAGYPDGTYRGNRALTRYEFAAGLNACLQQIERLLPGGGFDETELETLRRLIQEFEAELATLGARVDNLEGRVAFLEDNQFSTTTKLRGEVIFALTDEFNSDFDNNTVFQDRIRLALNTSFTGQDLLVTRLAAGNAELLNTGAGFEATQTFNIGNTGGNDVIVDWLAYYFNFGSSKVYVAGAGGIHSDYAPTLNPYFEDYDGGNGALSAFASESPIYRIGGGAGAAISLGAGPLERVLGPSTLTLGYLAGPGAENPGEDLGILNGEYAALAQLNFNLGDRIGIGATYVHGYHNAGSAIFDIGGGAGTGTDFGDGVVGTSLANNPGGFVQNAEFGSSTVNRVPTVTNTYGIQAAFRLSETISISGYGAYTDAILIGRGDSEIWTYGAGVALADLGKEGNVLGIFGGVQPYAGSINTPSNNFERGDDELPWHVEAFYKYQLTDNISLTPGLIWLLNPNQNDDNDDAVIGTLRTTFTF
ncbi:MAG: iron uptake porin [Coleofasciculus sp. D1-CHI-01]|uniref:iron uptake porin n=1 Tax=Coleofasciculus sp. D1-CHI-01 TaxID=3068482 RepID=UPI0032FA4604